MIRALVISFIGFFAAVFSTTATPDDALFTAILQDHIDVIAVDYPGIAQDDRLDTYLAQIAATNPADLPSDDARLALWINAYNAYTLKLVASVPSAKTIREITGLGTKGNQDTAKPWDHVFATVGGTDYTLNQIENEIIRPRFKDARIHFALVCAAYSCPQLRNEAFVAERLDEQLNEQGRWFLEHRNKVDPYTRTAELSQIFDWFKDDFGDDEKALLRYIADYLPIRAKNSLRNEPHRWKVTYAEYDWSLNDRK
ncbi:MAG: DUF547 domain-containing protein [Synoicihabitans sp.]